MKSMNLLEYITNVVDDNVTLESARLYEKAFTRNRSMPFANALYFMLDMRTTIANAVKRVFQAQRGRKPNQPTGILLHRLLCPGHRDL